MRSFSEFCITESFRNFIGTDSIPARREWSTRVWALLSKAYADMGGIKGSGFSSEEDMVQNIPFWKLYTRGDKLIALILYKDHGGRKMVAAATDKSKESKAILANMLHSDFKVAYGEVSKAMLIFIMQNLPHTFIREVLLPRDEVRKILHDKEILDVNSETLPLVDSLDQKLYRKFEKMFGEFFYIRKIGGTHYMKVSLGKPNISIK